MTSLIHQVIRGIAIGFNVAAVVLMAWFHHLNGTYTAIARYHTISFLTWQTVVTTVAPMLALVALLWPARRR